MLIQKTFKVSKVSLSDKASQLEDVWLLLKGGKQAVVLGGVYIPPRGEDESNAMFLELQDRVKSCKELQYPVLMV